MPAFRPDFSLILFYTCRRFPIYIGKCFYFAQMFSSQTQVTAAKRLPIYETILLVNFFFLKEIRFLHGPTGANRQERWRKRSKHIELFDFVLRILHAFLKCGNLARFLW